MAEAKTTSGLHGDRAAQARLRARHRAEWRLRAYGIAAITIAALALGALVASVAGKAGLALSETYFTMPVELDQRAIDRRQTGDPKRILRGDFNKVVKTAFRDTFPEVTDRRARRALGSLVSAGAAFELAAHVAADPALVGQAISFDLLASDTADLYLKGEFGKFRPMPVVAGLTVEVEDETATITSSDPNFLAALTRARARLITDADRLGRQAALQDNAVLSYRAELADARTDGAREDAAAAMARHQAEGDDLRVRVAALRERAASIEGTETLTTANRSLLIKAGAGWIKLTEIGADGASGQVIRPGAEGDHAPGDWQLLMSDLAEESRKVSDAQAVWIETLAAEGRVKTVFNRRFFSAGDSRDAELAGIWGAAVGSFWTMLVTIVLAFPVGVLSAIYLEEFARKSRLTDVIEVNINNLAAVPSIIFGLLGLSVVIGFFGVPRSAPLAGGFVLALMTLPTIIIAARASIAAVPPSIREAALGVGASKVQTAFHHVLPLALPGVLTGTIIGMARALGETAPLIMIGMVAFIVDIPGGITDSASVLPVQVFRWADFPERAFEARTAAAICTLLVFLILMNGLAVFLRRRFERRW